MPTSVHFEYESVARSASITDAQLRALEQLFASDYPNDAMLRELHILRACNAVKEGRAQIEDILRGGEAAA